PRWGVALAAAAAVLVAITVIGYLNSGGSSPQPNDLAGNAPSATTAPTQPAARTPEPGLVASKPPVTGAQLRLRVIGGASWVSIRNASTTLFEGVLRDGEFKDFTDPTRLRVVVGNAVAVSLNCGGRDSGPAGASGAVKRFECTAAGLKSL
ncbi:MAG: DUF4115 domain-containing protein, partial [Mycobacteriales bacterium]